MEFVKRLFSSLRSSHNQSVRASEQDSSQAERLIEQGNLLEDSGELAAALKCYQDAIASAPLSARAHLNRGNVLQAKGSLREALDAYKKAIELQPDYAGAYVNLGNTHMRLAEPAKAIWAYQQALELSNENGSVEVALAAAQEAASRYSEAADTYRLCLARDSKSVAALLGLARSLRALERPQAALEAVRQLLHSESASPDGLYLEGEILSELGHHEAAIASFNRALKVEPQHFLALTSMGDSHRHLGHDSEALSIYLQASKLHANVALLHVKLAQTYFDLGMKQPAVISMNRALELDPKSSSLQFNAGNLFESLGEYLTAATHFQRAIALSPEAPFYNNLGVVQRKLGRHDDAMSSFRQAIALDPNCAEAHSGIGLALQRVGMYSQALASHQMACVLQPDNALFRNNKATALIDADQLEEAEQVLRKALELEPGMVDALLSLGFTQLALGRPQDAIPTFERALALHPGNVKARHNLSHARLTMGQLKTGWPDFECRFEEIPNCREPSPLPQWIGQTTKESDRILLFVEQGLGDMLQFVRYLPLVESRFPGGVSLYAMTPLVSLFRRSFPNVEILDKVPVDQSKWQWQCALLSLPLAFGTVLETIPAQVPYLIPDPVRRAKWSERIQRLTTPTAGTKKIGIVWKPGPAMKIAHLKATSLQTLSPLFGVTGCTWFSLQKESDPEKTPFVTSGQLIDWSADFHDFDDTAALAVNMDLVISVDTSVAHLAGGLGLPTWLLNRYASDWRWMREREDSPWYPTVRIFSQDAPGNWERVAQRVAQALANWVSAENASNWRIKGNRALQSGDLVEAQCCYERGIQANSTDAACHANLGFVLMQQGHAKQAKAALSQAVALDPSDADALYLLGSLSRNEGDCNQAVEYFQRALQVKQDFEHCRRELCLTLVQAGHLEDARATMQDGIPSVPPPRDALVFQGTMHLAFGEYENAVGAFIAASQLSPLNPDELINLGAAQIGQRNAAAAVATYQKVLDTDPDHVMALYNQATALQLNGDVDSAIKGFRRALAIDPENVSVHQSLLGALTLSTACSSAEYGVEARAFGRHVANMAVPFGTWPCQMRSLEARALRVGFVSGDLRQHPVGYFLLAALKHLDSSVISCIAYSNAAVEDAFSQQLKPYFTEWQPVVGLSDQELAKKIHADAIDVLIDLSGHTAHNRLPVFAWRPSPVQVTWLGYWASTGMVEMDYVLADEVSLPVSDARFYTEQPWYLPNTRLCFTPPDSTVLPGAPPVIKNGFVTFGSFQKLDKISDATLSGWAAVLNALPTARIRLQSRPLGFLETAAHMLERMTCAGLDTSRVDLLGGVSRDLYLQAYNEIDIVLDTFPFPGGTTTAEALWMGVPTVTFSGQTLIARQGESMLRCLGLDDWVVYSTEDFVRIAVTKAKDTENLALLRTRLRDMAGQSPLYDAASFAQHLTLALRTMAQKHSAE